MRFLAHLTVPFAAFAAVALAAAPPLRPDPVLTPGVVDPAHTLVEICQPGFTARKGVRHVTPAMRARVFAEYGVDRHADRYEIDHLIPLELGGSNDIGNLWPQSYTAQPLNAYRKDALEDRLHALVCAGALPLDIAQHAIAADWVAAWRLYLAPPN